MSFSPRLAHDSARVSFICHRGDVSFSPDGRYVATARVWDSQSGDATARVWDSQSGAEIARLAHDSFVIEM